MDVSPRHFLVFLTIISGCRKYIIDKRLGLHAKFMAEFTSVLEYQKCSRDLLNVTFDDNITAAINSHSNI